MKKVLLPFDGDHFSAGAFEYARKINELEPILLTGVFLPPADYTQAWNYAYSGTSVYIPLVENRDPLLVKNTIDIFETMCLGNGIEYRIHQDVSSFALKELQKETRFADLMILGSQQFYENLGSDKPNEYLRDTLHDTECPVIAVPDHISFPESIVLAYDGSRSSVHAIKSFAALFPLLCNKKTTLIYTEHKPGEGIPEEKLIRELCINHFSNISFQELHPDTKKNLNTWLSDIEKPLLVSGAYGRSGISQLLHKGFITNVIAEHRIPVFIAHF